MAHQPDSVDNIQQIYDELKKYIQLQAEYIKIEFVEKLTILLSKLMIIFIICVLSIAALFYLFFSLAYLLVPIIGSIAGSFAFVAAIFVIGIVIFYSFRKNLVINPLAKFLSNLFLKH
jgi:membrane-bound ClpP family serine protease